MTPKNISRVYRGISAAPGLTAGPVYIWLENDLTLPTPYKCEDPVAAWQKILAAIEDTQIEIGQMREQVLQEGDASRHIRRSPDDGSRRLVA